MFISSVALIGIGLNKTDQYSGQTCDTACSVKRHRRQELSPRDCDECEEGCGNGGKELRHGKGHGKVSVKGSVQKKAVMMTGAAEHRLPNTDEAVKTLKGDTFKRAMTRMSENSGR